MIRRTFLGLLLTALAFAFPLFATGKEGPEPSAVWSNTLAKLDRQAAMDSESSMLLMLQLQKEFGTSEEELRWSVAEKMSGSEIAVLAYIQATTGKSFAEMNQENARRDFWVYAENAGMSHDKMALWLNGFQKRLERERNSRIFDRLRASRKVHPLPDLGSGFGLFQEALDFRRMDSPRPTKVHGVGGELAKGEK